MKLLEVVWQENLPMMWEDFKGQWIFQLGSYSGRINIQSAIGDISFELLVDYLFRISNSGLRRKKSLKPNEKFKLFMQRRRPEKVSKPIHTSPARPRHWSLIHYGKLQIKVILILPAKTTVRDFWHSLLSRCDSGSGCAELEP